MLSKTRLRHHLKVLAILCVAPFVIGTWIVAHPVLVWREAKKSWFGKT